MADEQEEKGIFRRAHERGMKSIGGAGGAVNTVTRPMSQALMASAFERFGHAFTDTGDVAKDAANEQQRMGPWRQAGAKSAQALQMRWETMEFEEFQESEIQGFTQETQRAEQKNKALHAMLDDGKYFDEVTQEYEYYDAKTEQGLATLHRKRNQLVMDFADDHSSRVNALSSAAGKYPGNSMIANQMLTLMQAGGGPGGGGQQGGGQGRVDREVQQRGIQAEKTYSDMRMDDRASKTAAMNARTAARTAKQAGTKEKRPQSPTEVISNPEWGGKNMIQWKGGSPEGTVYMTEGAGSKVLTSVTARHRQYLIDEEGFEDKGPDHPETLKLDQRMAEDNADIFNEAVLEDTRLNQPEQYRQAKLLYPYMFEEEEALEEKRKVQGLIPENTIPDGRTTKKQRKGIVSKLVKAIRPSVDEELRRWASDTTNPTDVESALAHMEKWLKEQVVDTDNTNAGDIIVNDTIEKEMAYLRRNWGKISDILKEQNPGLFIKQKTAKMRII